MALEYQTEAILLAARDWSAADRVVTLFSHDHGIVTAMVYGARKPKSKLGGAMQPLSHLSLSMAAGRGMDSVKQCEVRTSFRPLREDLSRLAYANFIAELTTGLWPERKSEPEVFDTLLDIFNLLALRNPRITALVGAWHLLVFAGFQPEYRQCSRCGQKLSFPAHFSFADGGSLCNSCRSPGTLDFGIADRDLLEKIFALDLKQPGKFAINAKTLICAEMLLHGFVRHQLERPLKSLNFINKVSGLSPE